MKNLMLKWGIIFPIILLGVYFIPIYLDNDYYTCLWTFLTTSLYYPDIILWIGFVFSVIAIATYFVDRFAKLKVKLLPYACILTCCFIIVGNFYTPTTHIIGLPTEAPYQCKLWWIEFTITLLVLLTNIAYLVVPLILRLPRPSSKTDKLEQQVADLQKQIDEMKKGE